MKKSIDIKNDAIEVEFSAIEDIFFNGGTVNVGVEYDATATSNENGEVIFHPYIVGVIIDGEWITGEDRILFIEAIEEEFEEAIKSTKTHFLDDPEEFKNKPISSIISKQGKTPYLMEVLEQITKRHQNKKV